ncbi:MAG: NAD(+) synthase [Bacteroidaceae bacterium]|nr:NAD(+) synthase [Bacteroidaceae bacterium]
METGYTFDAAKTAEALIQWTKEYFAQAGPDTKAVLGMSGGKDSTVSAAVLAKALGPDRVIGVSMPQGSQSLNDADRICSQLGIKMYTVNVGKACQELMNAIADAGEELTKASIQNIPPRVRMATLYAIGQTNNARVVNTCNLSEDYIGYATKFGDGAGDFSLLANLTVTEVLAIGDYLGVPYEWVHKTPDDGLPHSCPDEEKIGFTYAELDIYIRTGKAPEGFVHGNEAEGLKVDKIDRMHRANLHKLQPMPSFRF